jgi:hypothetical protein
MNVWPETSPEPPLAQDWYPGQPRSSGALQQVLMRFERAAALTA